MTTLIKKVIASCLLSAAILLISFSYVDAQQTTFRQQSWRYGVTGALQFNSASLGWQTLHGTDANFHSPEDNINRVDGTGIGAYGGIFGTYLSDSWWGLDLRISYDQRDALVHDDTRTPQPSFDIKMSYLSFAPSLRIDQNIIPNLNLHFGPFLNVNLTGTYYYKADKDQANADEEEYEISDRNIATYGIQGGLGYDILLMEMSQTSSMYITPFVDMSWLVNQRKSEGQPSQNSITDIWSTVSYRIGFRLSLDYRKYDDQAMNQSMLPAGTATTKSVLVEMPIDNVILTRNVKGYFPIIPYVFFEKQSQAIPSRYTLLTTDNARNFKETDLVNFVDGDLTTKETNIDQLMKSYYNIINIYADRMRNNPRESLTLRSSDPEDSDAFSSAGAIKKYMVDIFGIDADRITIESEVPQIPSGSAYTEEVSKQLIADENRRVHFVFSNPEMTKPLEYTIRDESSIDNDMFFSIDRSIDLRSWDITITGEGKTMYFGPYSYNYVRINPSELMRFLQNGRYNAKMAITHKNGLKTEENMSFRLTKETEMKNASRYLMLFDYNSTDAIRSYENIIRTEIAPEIITNSRVIVHGHTDNIGTFEGNRQLSKERADEVKSIIDNQLTIENRRANVSTIGVGQSINQYSFNNRFPEGRMYNRNIFVEVFE